MKTDKNKTFMSFFADCLAHMGEYNVNIRLHKESSFKLDFDNSMVRGSWDDSQPDKPPTLCCTIDGDPIEWISIFTHEYCHFLQWLDKDHIWKKYDKLDSETLSAATNNKPISKKDLEYVINCARDLELDCEKRAVKLIKNRKLPIDLDGYIRDANIYIQYYNYIKISREWYNDDRNNPFEDPLIRSVTPTSFYKSFDNIPPELLNAFILKFPPSKQSNLKSR